MAQPTTKITDISAWTRGWEKLQETGTDFVLAIPNLIVALIVLFVFYLLGRAVRWLIRRYATEKHKHRNVAIVMGRLAYGIILVLGVLVAAVIVFPNFTPASLLGFLGVGSLAAGFAFRDVLQNYLAGLLLLLTEPFRIGDQIVFKQFEGTVEEIQTRATLIRTYDGRRVVIPNTELFTEPVVVNTAFENRRLEYDVGIGVGDDTDRARELIVQAVRSCPGVLPAPPPQTLVVDLADFAVKVRVWYWTEPPQRRDILLTQDAVLSAIKKTLIENGIDLPYPTQQVLFHDQTEETDGDRSRQREGWPAGKGNVPRPRALAQRDTDGQRSESKST